MITLYPITYDKTKLASVPPDERVLHFMMAQIANEVSTLQRLLMLNLRKQADGESKESVKGRTAVALMLVRFLAGRLYEAWNLLQSPPHSKAYQGYAAKMPAEGRAALAELKRYFNKNSNLVGQVRHKVAFHLDFDSMRAGYDAMPEAETFTDFIANEVGNTLYDGASTISAVAMARLSGETDVQTGLGKVMDEVLHVSRQTVTYINEFMVVFVLRHVNPSWEEVTRGAIQISAPRLVDVATPYFCKASASDSTEV